MSIERVARAGSVVWRVRWREGDQNRSKVLGRKGDAIAFDAELRRRKRTGELAVLDAAGRQTLDDFAAEWLKLYAQPALSPRTLAVYASLWDVHVSPRIGGLKLREVSVEACQRFASDMAAAGVGPGARRKTLALLGGVLQRAVEWGRIPTNPARLVRKPSGRRERAVRPLAPSSVEMIRRELLAHRRHRDATLVSVLAYAGLRPGEALALQWGDIRERTLLIERAVADGQVKGTKTGQRRSARLLAPLKTDMAEWRMACGRPGDGALVFPTPAGAAWSEHDWRNWRRRIYAPAAAAAGLDTTRPYDLRHSAASLWIHEGRSIVEVAAWLGHSPQMALSTYAHVMSDLGDERSSAEAEIRAAREEHVPVSYLDRSGS